MVDLKLVALQPNQSVDNSVSTWFFIKKQSKQQKDLSLCSFLCIVYLLPQRYEMDLNLELKTVAFSFI